MTSLASVSGAANQDTNGLLSGIRWGSLDLTYGFPASAALYESGYGSGEPQKNFQPLNGIQRDVVRRAFSMISSLTHLTFSEVEEGPNSQATLRFGRSDVPDSAWAYYPGEVAAAGDAWFRASGQLLDNPISGGYAFYVFLHEIGHVIGLKHGHEPSGLRVLSSGSDSMEYSVMTYRSYVGAEGRYVENEQWGFAQTLMMQDIAALQHMYGADYTTRSGNTSYRWDPATGQTFVDGAGQGVPGGNRVFMTIWDGGGIDTYDLSRYRTGVVVNLNPGEWSRTSEKQLASLGHAQKARGNIANALLYHDDTGSLIENAVGGMGNDRIIGNEASNLLKGRGGADRLYGLEEADTLNGGGGRDVLTGGSGKDVFVFEAQPKKAGNRDRITDFSVTDDTIHLENRVFKKLGDCGRLSSKAFWKGAEAHDASDRIGYDRKSGGLYYDPDGVGGAPQVQFAQVSKKLKMTAADFFII